MEKGGPELLILWRDLLSAGRQDTERERERERGREGGRDRVFVCVYN